MILIWALPLVSRREAGHPAADLLLMRVDIHSRSFVVASMTPDSADQTPLWRLSLTVQDTSNQRPRLTP